MDRPRHFNEFCKGKKCPEFTEWDFGNGICASCKKVGQSYNIDEYPDDCNFIGEIKKYEAKLNK